ncbi:MAG: transposase [Blastocatellia bacterium]
MRVPKATTAPPRAGRKWLYHALATWTKIVAEHLPVLSQPQARVLAMWSLGMVLAQACGLTTVALYLAAGLGKKENTVRQQLREFYFEVEAKAGEQRQEIEIEICFEWLLKWVLEGWESQQLALALDATNLGQRFTVLCVSVLYRGCAIPVAWVVLRQTKKGAWRPHWLRLLRRLHRVVPPKMKVIVMADRGLYARWLFKRIRRLKWHPMLRVNVGGQFCPEGQNRFVPFKELVPKTGERWSGRGTAFKTPQARLRCTLLACWEEGYDDPWLLLTDSPPENADVAWYGLRSWIEQGFKLTKRGGWQWQKTRIEDPQRAARMWLAVAVATLWLVSIGGQADASIVESTMPDLIAVKHRRSGTRWRATGIFRRGAVLILIALLDRVVLPIGRFIPEAWPDSTQADPALTGGGTGAGRGP